MHLRPIFRLFVGIALVGSGLVFASPAMAATLGLTAIFEYNGTTGEDGSAQLWTVPPGVTSITVDASGAQGGDLPTDLLANLEGGLGGRAQATLTVTPGETLHVYVGGHGGRVGVVDSQGGIAYCEDGPAGSPGFNGGASGGGGTCPGAGGGGASDVRRAPGALGDRLIVAGGGGGGANGCPDGYCQGGGGGGGATGEDGTNTNGGQPGRGGTQGGGGLGGWEGGAGAFGSGGPGQTAPEGAQDGLGGGGGGGGWYGGGGASAEPAGGGGGGSGHFDPSASAQSAETAANPGDGRVVITYAFDTPACTITGTDANNTINGTSGNDVICALGGDDIVNGRGGNDVILTGPGNDAIRAGSTGTLLVDGGAGTDTFDLRSAGGAESLDLLAGSGVNAQGGTIGIAMTDGRSSVENVIGTPFADVIRGDDGPNRLDGNAGDDTLTGRDGDDVLLGNTGRDTMLPGMGDDTVIDGSDVNTISYADIAGEGVSIDLTTGKVSGAAGNDTFSASGVRNATGSQSRDTITGNGANNVLSGLTGSDVLLGGAGNDTLDGGLFDYDSCDGGPGTNTLVNCP